MTRRRFTDSAETVLTKIVEAVVETAKCRTTTQFILDIRDEKRKVHRVRIVILPDEVD